MHLHLLFLVLLFSHALAANIPTSSTFPNGQVIASTILTSTRSSNPSTIPNGEVPVRQPQEKGAAPDPDGVRITPTTAQSAAEARASASANVALLDTQNAAGISTGNVNNNLPDPCGPPNQSMDAPAGSESTCHRNVTTVDITGKGFYGVHCQNDNTGYVLNQATCSDAIYTICDQISGRWGSKYQATNEWIWSTDDGNCTFGYWLPEGGAPAPSYERCLDQIMGPIHDKCMGPEWNSGNVNLAEMPSANETGATSTGTPVWGEYPSYVMVAQSSYWGVNSMDAT